MLSFSFQLTSLLYNRQNSLSWDHLSSGPFPLINFFFSEKWIWIMNSFSVTLGINKDNLAGVCYLWYFVSMLKIMYIATQFSFILLWKTSFKFSSSLVALQLFLLLNTYFLLCPGRSASPKYASFLIFSFYISIHLIKHILKYESTLISRI